MRARWARFRRNARKGDVIKTGLLVGLTLLLMVMIEEARWLGLIPIAGFFVPWLFRDQLVDHGDLVLSAFRVVPFAAVALGLVADNLEDDARNMLGVAVWAGIGLFTGTFFWLLSDERVEMTYDQ